MKARVLQVVILILLMLAIVVAIKSGYAKEPASPPSTFLSTGLPPGIGERCNHSATFVDEIPARPGWDNAYGVDLPAGPDEDVVVCTAFMWDSDGKIYHFGFDAGAECQSGFCVAGMSLWKHYYDGKFWFWWRDPAAAGPPAQIELWFREVNPREVTPTPDPGPDPAPTQDPNVGNLIWLPLVQQ